MDALALEGLFRFLHLNKVFFQTKLRNPADQVKRDWFIQRELDSSFGCFVTIEFISEVLDSFGARVKTDMMNVTRKMNQITVELKGGNAVTDCLSSIWCHCFNRLPDLLELNLYILWELADEVIDRFLIFGFHFYLFCF